MKSKKYFFSTSTCGTTSDCVFKSLTALRRALLDQFLDNDRQDDRLYVHHIDGDNIYYCGSVTFDNFYEDFRNLEFYNHD